MLRPKLSTVIHIPLIEVMEYFKRTYGIDTDYYWDILTDHHMFRGNDSSMEFYGAMSNEIPNEEVANILPWPEQIKSIILDDNGHPGDIIYTAINTSTVTEWAELYKLAVILKKKEERNPTIDEHWPNYLIRCMFECMVMSEYQLETDNNVFYHISW
jgi:hypothetical protein